MNNDDQTAVDMFICGRWTSLIVDPQLPIGDEESPRRFRWGGRRDGRGGGRGGRPADDATQPPSMEMNGDYEENKADEFMS